MFPLKKRYALYQSVKYTYVVQSLYVTDEETEAFTWSEAEICQEVHSY